MNREELKKEAQEQVNYCTPLYPESFIQGYLAGAEPRENKIADIKANCDLAIEGRDIKIKELELELTVEKDQHQEETNLHIHAEEYIKSLEQKLEQAEKDLADYQFNYPKIKELEKENAELKLKIEHRNCVDCSNHHSNIKLLKAKKLLKQFLEAKNSEDTYKAEWEAEQFLKETEK